MKTLILIFVLFFSNNVFSAQKFYQDEKFKFSIHYPIDWLIRKTDFESEFGKNNVKFEIYLETNSHIGCNISRGSKKYENISQNELDAYISELNTKDFWIKTFSNVVDPVIVNNNSTLLDQNKDKKVFALSVIIDYTFPQNINLRIRQHVTQIVLTDQQYNITCGSPLENYNNKIKNDFDFISSSFSLSNK